MLLWWGEHSIQIYNDATRRDLLADRHPRALGAPAAETWGRAWHELGAAVTSVHTGGGAIVLEDLALEDRRTWSFCLSPVPDGRGGIAGVLVMARDDGCELRRGLPRAPALVVPVCPRADRASCAARTYIVEVANKAMTDAFDRELEEVLGRPVFEAVPDLRVLFEPLLVAIVASGEPRLVKEMQYRTEAHAQTAGASVATRMACSRHSATFTATSKACSSSRSRSPTRSAPENEMHRLRGVAEDANRAKDEFLAMLGHELRNPLSPIATALQVLRMRGMTGTRARRARAPGRPPDAAGRRSARRVAGDRRQDRASSP